jgi:hypothetical protein
MRFRARSWIGWREMIELMAVAALVGAVAGRPLWRWARRLDAAKLDRIESRCLWLFPPLLGMLVWTLFLAYPPAYILTMGPLMVYAGYAGALFSSLLLRTNRYAWVHGIATALLFGFLITEVFQVKPSL